MVRPYSTFESEGSFVIKVIVAELWVVVAETLEIEGGVVSGGIGGVKVVKVLSPESERLPALSRDLTR